MILLEEAEVDRLRQKQIPEYDPTIGAMAHAQSDIDDARTRSKLSDEQKLNLVFQAQQRFRIFVLQLDHYHHKRQQLQ